MKKWLLLLIVTMILTSILSATTVKVAVLPLKRLDSASKYIQKFLTIRDLEHTFNTNATYELLNLKTTADAFKDMDINDIDEMEKEDMAEIGKELKADVVILGSISAVNDRYFSIQFRFYSMKTQDLKSQNLIVEKDKKRRWNVLEKDLLGKLADFINDEMDKMTTLAIQDYHAENYKQSEQGFNTVLNYSPNNKQALYYLGMIAYQQKNYDKAVSDFTKSMPDSIKTQQDTLATVKVLRSLSDTYRDKGDKSNMISILEKQADLQQDEEMWLTIANLYAENKQIPQAKTALLNALNINEDFLKAQYRMAFLLYDNGNYKDAIPYLEKAATINPDNDLIARRLSFSYQKAGEILKAIDQYEDNILSNPKNESAYLNLAGLYRAAAAEAADNNNQALVAENNQKALDTLVKLQKVAPESATLYLRFSDTYLAMNKFTEAEASANTSLSNDGTQYQPYIILATINQRKGTDQYNVFIDKDKQFQKAVGRTADRLSKERDAARISANNSFRKAEEQLKAAKVRATEPEVISDIDGKLRTVTQLIIQTGKG